MPEADQTVAPPFLRLPESLRLKIYCLAGGVVGNLPHCTINLNNNGVPKRLQFSLYGIPKKVEFGHMFTLTYNLLQTCRTIYSEVSASFFSTYHVHVRYSERGNLEALRRLSVGSVHALRLLTIHLNVASCGLNDPFDYENQYDEGSPGKRDRPLRANDDSTAKLLAEWQDTWSNYIKPHISEPASLRLNFTCDVEDMPTAYKFVQPLVAGPKKTLLAGCSVRLSYRRNPSLRELAEQVVAIVTGKAKTLESSLAKDDASLYFRFMDLPAEIRHRILGHTGLVPSSREIEWNPSHGFYYRDKMDGGHVRLLPWSFRSYLPPIPGEDIESLRCWDTSCHGGGGCYCKLFHGASSSIYSCKCRATPGALFLVSRTMRRDALQVFFSQNRFVIAPTGGVTWTAVSHSPSRLHASIFLKDIVPEIALQNLRYIELVFPPFGKERPCNYCPDESPEYLDWIQTLEYVKDKLNVNQLIVRACFANFYPQSYDDMITEEDDCSYRQEMSVAQSRAIQDCHVRILEPFKRIKGLRHFFVHLPNSRAWSGNDEDAENREVTMFEREIETLVMGGDYDATTVGKEDRVESQWLADEDTHSCGL